MQLLWPRFSSSGGQPSVLVSEPTRTNLRLAIQEVEPGGIIHVAAGTYDIAGYGDPILIDKSVVLNLGTATLNVVEDAEEEATHLFNVVAGDNKRLVVSGGTINGPQTPNDQVHCFNWIENNTPDSSVQLLNVTVTGQYGYVLHRAGGGHIVIHECDFDAYEGCIAFFGNNSEPGSLVIEDSQLSCTDGKNTSIGMYIHPHFSIESARNVYSDFSRYGIYCNGSPLGDFPSIVSIDDTFHNCDIIQSTNQSTAYLINAQNTGVNVGSGTLIRGDAVFVGLTFDAESTSISTLSNLTDHDVTFIDCEFNFTGVQLGFNGNSEALMRFMGCTFNLAEGTAAYALTTHSGFTGTIDMGDTVINDGGTTAAWLIQTQGACTIDWNRCVFNTNKEESEVLSQIHASTTEIGAPSIVPLV